MQIQQIQRRRQRQLQIQMHEQTQIHLQRQFKLQRELRYKGRYKHRRRYSHKCWALATDTFATMNSACCARNCAPFVAVAGSFIKLCGAVNNFYSRSKICIWIRIRIRLRRLRVPHESFTCAQLRLNWSGSIWAAILASFFLLSLLLLLLLLALSLFLCRRLCA